MNHIVIFTASFAFILGSIIGSFMNVCIYRLPRKLSIVKPRSFCPECRTPIPWYQNIPIVSYLFLMGKCSFCRTWISPIYPFVEAVNGLFYLWLHMRFGFSLEFVLYAPFVSALIILFFIDYREKILPDEITLSGIVFGIGLSPLIERLGVLNSVSGAAVGFIIFYFIAFLYERIAGKEGMGGGDVKMIAMVGAVLGLKGVMATIFIASLLGALFGIYLIIFHKKDFKYAVPFGCFISIGAVVFLVAGEMLSHWYFQLIGLHG